VLILIDLIKCRQVALRSDDTETTIQLTLDIIKLLNLLQDGSGYALIVNQSVHGKCQLNLINSYIYVCTVVVVVYCLWLCVFSLAIPLRHYGTDVDY
jgi:hypothetical protein